MLGYTLIFLSFIISIVGAVAAQRMSHNYLAPFFAGVVFYTLSGYFSKFLDFEQNDYLQTGLELLMFVFGLYLG